MTMLELLKYIKVYMQVMLGQVSKTIIRPGQVYTGPFVCVQAINECTLTSFTDTQISEGAFQANDIIDSGAVVFGNITNVEISAGLMIGYKQIL